MNDRILLDNYLLILKSTVEVYVHGTLESSNNDIRNLLKSGLDETLNSQADTYNIMTKNNWYQVCNIDIKTIKKSLNKIKKTN